jgi:uncharacterized protein
VSDALPPEPEKRLSPRALTAWMATGAGEGLVAVLIATVALHGAWWAVVGALAFLVVAALVVPVVRYYTWRYSVREEEIDLRHGAWIVRRTIIPMARVQHVDTSVTPFGQLLGIATLTIHTAAGKHSIPGLELAVADYLRTQIASNAREADDV